MSNQIAFYLRSATGDRDDLSRQKRTLEREFLRRGFDSAHWHVRVYVDEIQSGLRPGPAFLQMQQDLQDGKINAIMVERFNRVSRSMRELSKFLDFVKSRRLRFVSANENMDTSLWPAHVGGQA